MVTSLILKMEITLKGDAVIESIPSLKDKALRINLNENIYGTFAEIGAGQETVRHFFRAGGASGTIAKAMSAYEKSFFMPSMTMNKKTDMLQKIA